jgi:acetyl-CoA acyltransferase 1
MKLSRRSLHIVLNSYTFQLRRSTLSKFVCRSSNVLEADLQKSGGAIAVTHPLGMTGVRQVVTGLAELRRTDGKILCTSMCVGMLLALYVALSP